MSENNNTVVTETLDSLKAQIAKLTAKNAALVAAKQRPLSCKVSEKGAVSVYGMQRFPITLYKAQWEKLFATNSMELIKKFIAENEAALAVKE